MRMKATTTACAIALLLAGLLLSSAALAGKPPKDAGPPPPAADPQIVYLERDIGIRVMDADGSNKRTVVPVPRKGIVSNPVWSPDGDQIAFHGQLNEVQGIYIVNVDGSDLRLVSRTNLRYFAEPAPKVDWSRVPAPDGNYKLVYGEWRGDDPSGYELYLVNPDGSGLLNLMRVRGQPAWASDARRLLVGREIFHLGLDEEGNIFIQATTELPMSVNYPRWANQHDWVCGYPSVWPPSGLKHGYLDLEADPLQWHNLPFQFSLWASFSPDDTRLVFAIDYKLQNTTYFEIRSANLDGSDVATLAVSKNALGVPDWKRPPLLMPEEELLMQLLLEEQGMLTPKEAAFLEFLRADEDPTLDAHEE